MEIGRDGFGQKKLELGKIKRIQATGAKGNKREVHYARAIWISPYQRCILPEHLASTVPTIQTGLNGPRGQSRPRSQSQISEHSAVANPRVGGERVTQLELRTLFKISASSMS
jgi:hypothetical protein